MAEIDRTAIEDYELAETALMETAGQMTARHMRRHILEPQQITDVAILCGKGHNGADGFVAARWLDRWGYSVTVMHASEPDDFAELTQKQAVSIEKHPKIEVLTFEGEIPRAGAYLDALLGTGLAGDPRAPYDDIIHQVNSRPQSTVCLDIPSGLSGDDPIPFEPCVHGDLTVTFGLPKLGMLLEPGFTLTGTIIVQELCFPEETYQENAGNFHLISPTDTRPFLKHRRLTDHKGVAGRLSVIAGSEQFPGAPSLVGSAGYSVGAGLVNLIAPEKTQQTQTEENRDVIYQYHQNTLLEKPVEILQTLQETSEAFVVGPGLGQGETQRETLKQIIPHLQRPAVIDADGLNNLTGEAERFADAENLVLTPHPGEASRLLDKPVAEIMKNPVDHVRELVTLTEQIVILKAARPIVGYPSGSISVNISGTPALAKAGSGDVLSGMIGGFLAQGIPTGPASCLALYLHGAAGRSAERNQPTTTIRSGDIIEEIPDAISEFEEPGYPEWYPVKYESHGLNTLTWHPFK